MTLKQQLKADLKTAMIEKNITKRDTIRSINTMIKQIEVDERIELDNDAVIVLIQKGIKTRTESITQFQAASRDDLVKVEQEQIDIFNLYLPKQLSDDELKVIISNIIDEVGATSMRDMGKIMPKAKEMVGVQANGKRINETIKSILG